MLPIIRTFISLPGRRRADAVLALQRCSRSPAACRGSSCSTFTGKQAGDNWDGLEGHAALRRLRGRGADRRSASSTSSSAGAAADRGRAARCAGLADALPLRHALALGRAPRARRAAADLLLGAHDARAVAAGLALRRPRRRAAQGVRGRAARRDGRRPAGRAARRGRRRRARARPPARAARARLVRAAGDRRLHARAADRASASGRRRTIAVGLLLGSAALVARRPRGPTGRRRDEDAASLDALALGARAGVRADAGRLAQRHDAGRGAGARLRPRRRQRALAPRRRCR